MIPLANRRIPEINGQPEPKGTEVVSGDFLSELYQSWQETEVTLTAPGLPASTLVSDLASRNMMHMTPRANHRWLLYPCGISLTNSICSFLQDIGIRSTRILRPRFVRAQLESCQATYLFFLWRRHVQELRFV